jgi:bifunctional NMN adenylyltransferase/nudix hydrolase
LLVGIFYVSLQHKINKMKNLNAVGVVIGRFQAPELHEGHTGLLDHVTENHKNVVVFLGIPRIQNSKRNPLDFATRRKMVQNVYPDVIVLPLDDNRSDHKWSTQIDNAIRSMFPETDAVLYGSRDSFIPHYHGNHSTEEYPQVDSHNATDLRAEAANTPLDSDEFRSGVIYGIHRQRPVTYPTVDVVVVDGDKILLARKPSETLFRFVGGFVDRTDENWEMAARRELYEETKLSALKMHYVCSQAVEDWRYAREENGIMTTLFMTYAWDQMGRPEASDDIAEVKWLNIKDLFSVITDPSQGNGHVPNKNYVFHIEDKIVPEHIKLMETFIKKVVEENLITLK